MTRLSSADEAEKWLAGGYKPDRIIANQKNGQRLMLMAGKMLPHRTVPVLICCGLSAIQSVETTSLAKATDLLITDESDYSLESKIAYYLQLSAAVSTVQEADQVPAMHRFRLPWWKRFIDISVSLTLLVILSPLLMVVALLIVLDSKGPVLYKSKRAGANFYIFNMYKFRTMKVKADQLISKLSLHNIYANKADSNDSFDSENSRSEYMCSACRQQGVSCQQPLFDQNQSICEKLYLQENEELAKFMKFRNDPRITRLGTFLRNSSIDELPQLVNVLTGDMSLVGNRPLPLYEAEKLTTDESARRFAGPAGLTGIWQTKKRAKGQGVMSDRERILLDIEYASTFSFKTDMYIIWKTFFSLWQKENV
ncbi:sugar transferase [Spirosoma utsteinense]|uniref:sugar transferase n=1 Tax=Spirosoma utsteinense TaxID=2585773 RepID=UPI001EB2CCE3|nr:sugar transferase [Spirosoma utsteinense]MBC3786900.1 lipopolysaccharide/colanic/teichoic acid biosynthesis glycosyltransferase [Spirosoma utsteinense]